MKILYVAGPFRAATPWGIEQNVRTAEAAALKLWQANIVALCPHLLTRFFQYSCPDQAFVDGTLDLMRRCDAVLVVGDWEQSEGTRGEVAEARQRGLPIYFSVEEAIHGSTDH